MLAAIALLRRERALWPLASVPVLFALLSVVTATIAFAAGLDEIHALWSAFAPELEVTSRWAWLWIAPARLLFFLLAWLAVLVSFAVALVAAILVAKLLSAPFLDRLSERVEALAGHEPLETASRRTWLSSVLGSFWAELQRVAFLASVWLLLAVSGALVPGAHLVTGPIFVAVMLLFLPLDYAGFALDRRGLRFRERRRWLREHRATMLGFGAIAFVSALVPGLNLVMLPTLVTAATLMVVRRPPVAVVGSGR